MTAKRDNTELAKNEPQALSDRQPTMLEMIAQATRDPMVDVAKMRELLAMQKEIIGEERRIAYVDAMSKAQNALPQFVKSARVVVKGTERSRFAPIEDIDAVLRPICFEYGFTIDDDVKAIDGKNVLVICKVSHKDGHFVEKTLPVPIDFSDYRSGSQSTVASVTLAKRHLRKMHFNIVERGEDSNGENKEAITEAESAALTKMITDSKSDVAKFLQHFKVESVSVLLRKDYPEALQMLKAKLAKQVAI